mmetsp:Transcript_29553/g.45040  ORF Transcript_29553/g.45040 Transcript_29553/m.45040 type:complete len:179 (+) Transcript_29553:3056-3592(+)
MNTELAECALLAADMEYYDARFQEDSQALIFSLMQVSTWKSDYIFDIFMVRDALRRQKEDGSLAHIFANEGIVKILHGSDNDLKLLAADLDMIMVNLFDTARVLGFIHKLPENFEDGFQIGKNMNFLSLDKLTKLFLDIDMDKFFQVSDWAIRPLPEGMMNYARSDTHYLIPTFLLVV